MSGKKEDLVIHMVNYGNQKENVNEESNHVYN